MLIRGVVTGLDGSALDGAVVSFVEAPTDVPDIAAMTGDDGTFVLVAPVAGRYRLAVRADEHRPTDLDVDVRDGDAEISVPLQPDAD